MTKNLEATRAFSDKHEKSVCKALGARQTPNSGATAFTKGDVIHKDASLLIECKCCETPKQSVGVKLDWIKKNKEEAFAMRLSNQAVCINYGPDTPNYYVIDEKLMRFLVDKLIEDEQD